MERAKLDVGLPPKFRWIEEMKKGPFRKGVTHGR